MSANYWDSTQHQFWTFTRPELAAARARLEDENMDLIQMFPLPGPRDLSVYFNSQINRLAKRLGARQQAVCTAQVYVKRFYIRVEIRRTNPYLVMATSLYLACKIEECPQHIRLVVGEARALWQDLAALDISRVGECEFFLISEMSSHLIIHHPHRTLATLQSDFGLSAEEISLTWGVISDSWMTDLPLLFPPHVIAAAAILMTLAPWPIGGGGTGGAAAAAATAVAAAAAAVGAAAASGSSLLSAPPGPESPATAANPAATAFLAHMQQSRGGGTVGARDEPYRQQQQQQQNQSQQHQQRLQQHQYQSQHQQLLLLLPHSQQQQQQQQHQHQLLPPQQQQSQQEVAKERERSQQELGTARAHRLLAWLSDARVDMADVVNCTQEIISFNEYMEQHRDKLTREQINWFVKARGLDK